MRRACRRGDHPGICGSREDGCAKVTPMRTFTIVPRHKKYWIKATSGEGAHQLVIAFATEDAALRCLKDFQQREERRQLSDRAAK
jgi:hypothetical protein